MAEITKPSGMNKIWASNGAVVTPDDTKIARGWVVEAPGHQTENYLNRKHDQAFAHLNQHGFFEWAPDNTEYIANKSWTMGSNGWIYRCKSTHTSPVNPVTDASQTYWRPILNGETLVTSPEISAYMKIVLTSPDAFTAKQNLGFTTIGQQLTSSNNSLEARNYLGFSSIGNQLATADSQLTARNIIGIAPASTTQEGLVVRATDSEAILGTNDTKFLTPKHLKLGFSQTLSNPGQYTFPSPLGGIIMRWGNIVLNSNQSATVTTFPSACLTGQATTYSTSTDGSGGPFISRTSNSLVITNAENSARSIEWFAIGY